MMKWERNTPTYLSGCVGEKGAQAVDEMRMGARRSCCPPLEGSEKSSDHNAGAVRNGSISPGTCSSPKLATTDLVWHWHVRGADGLDGARKQVQRSVRVLQRNLEYVRTGRISRKRGRRHTVAAVPGRSERCVQREHEQTVRASRPSRSDSLGILPQRLLPDLHEVKGAK